MFTSKGGDWGGINGFFNSPLDLGVLSFKSGHKSYGRNVKNEIFNEVVLSGSGCAEDQCVSACEDGWKEYDGHCYYLSASNNNKSWTAAEDFCRQEGGHLASMVDDGLKDRILEEMTKSGHDWIWLGGIEEESVWKWVDCTPWNVTFWASGEPTIDHEECLTLVLNFPGYTHLNKKWNDKSCSYERGFLCKKKICQGLNDGKGDKDKDKAFSPKGGH